MHNSDITIGKNVRYFMYKYKIVLYMMIGSMIILIYLTQLIIIIKILHSWMMIFLADSGIVQVVDRNYIRIT